MSDNNSRISSASDDTPKGEENHQENDRDNTSQLIGNDEATNEDGNTNLKEGKSDEAINRMERGGEDLHPDSPAITPPAASTPDVESPSSKLQPHSKPPAAAAATDTVTADAATTASSPRPSQEFSSSGASGTGGEGGVTANHVPVVSTVDPSAKSKEATDPGMPEAPGSELSSDVASLASNLVGTDGSNASMVHQSSREGYDALQRKLTSDQPSQSPPTDPVVSPQADPEAPSLTDDSQQRQSSMTPGAVSISGSKGDSAPLIHCDDQDSLKQQHANDKKSQAKDKAPLQQEIDTLVQKRNDKLALGPGSAEENDALGTAARAGADVAADMGSVMTQPLPRLGSTSPQMSTSSLLEHIDDMESPSVGEAGGRQGRPLRTSRATSASAPELAVSPPAQASASNARRIRSGLAPMSQDGSTSEDPTHTSSVVLAERVISEEEMRLALRRQMETEDQREMGNETNIPIAEPLAVSSTREQAPVAKRRWSWVTLMTLIVLIAVVVAVVLGVVLTRDGSTNSSGSINNDRQNPATDKSQLSGIPSTIPSQSPSGYPTVSTIPSEDPTYGFEQTDAFFDLVDLLAPILEGEPTLINRTDWSNPNRVAHQTLDWMANGDNPFVMELVQNDPQHNVTELLEFYALVSLYWSTNGPWWEDEGEFLSTSHLCDWSGIHLSLRCDEDRHVDRFVISQGGPTVVDPAVYHLSNMVELEMDSETLSFSLSSYIGMLDQLNVLNIKALSLTGPRAEGTVPTEIGSMKNLRIFRVSGSYLSGTIPSEIGECSRLEEMTIEFAQIDGSLPSEMGNLASLTTLQLGYNRLTGSVPTEVGMLESLQTLFLSSNQLNGTIPSEMARMMSLTQVYLDNNEFGGSIPTEVGLMVNLKALLINSNHITGNVPSELGRLTSLIQLYIDANELEGSIPTEVGNMTLLEEFDMSSNHINGTVPSEIGHLDSLGYLNFASNELEGTIPAEIANLAFLGSLWMHETEITGDLDPLFCLSETACIWISADCSSAEGKIPEVNCSCCWCEGEC